jgi:hypothetical protein
MSPPDLAQINEAHAQSHQQRFNMPGYAAPQFLPTRSHVHLCHEVEQTRSQ